MSMGVIVLLLMMLGVMAMVMEVLVLPGFGVIGVLGLGAMGAAGYLAWKHLGTGYGILSIGAGAVIGVVLLWVIPRTRAGRELTLSHSHTGTSAARDELGAFIGKTGRAVTPLRPAGTAEIDEQSVDVVTDGLYVEAGRPLRVVRVDGARIVVEPIGEG